MDIGKRIKHIREKRGVTLLQVAEFLDVTEATVQRYESGNIKNLKLDSITKIAEFLNVNPSYLMGWSNVVEDVRAGNEYSFYPTSISAGVMEVAEPVVNYELEKIRLPDAALGKWAGHRDLKIMRINGESMNKEIPSGSLIVVKPTDFPNLKDGDTVVFNKEYEYSAKVFYDDKENNRFIFRPNSSDPSFTEHIIKYEDADNLCIEGRVVVFIVERN